MTRSQSTPTSSQIIWLERRVAELEKQRDEYANEARRQMQHVAKVLKQRDELLAALEVYINAAMARAAIASVKGGV